MCLIEPGVGFSFEFGAVVGIAFLEGAGRLNFENRRDFGGGEVVGEDSEGYVGAGAGWVGVVVLVFARLGFGHG